MPRVLRQVLVLCLLAAPASAQWRGYAPDSAEYRLVMRSRTVGDSTRGMTSSFRAIVNARRRGDDSLTVHVNILESSISFGDHVIPGPAAGAPVADVVIPRQGMAPMTGNAAEPPIAGVSGFPHLFVLLAYPRRDSAGTRARDSGPDSLPLVGMRSTVHRSTLPDTVVAGVRVSRQAVEMVIENDSSVVVRPGLPPTPPMRMRNVTEHWVDADHRVTRATMASQLRPVGGKAGEAQAIGRGIDIRMEFERVSGSRP